MSCRVTFSLLPEQRVEAERYAVARGLGSVSNLARFAMFQLMTRYPAGGRKQARKGEDGKGDGAGGEDRAGVLPEAFSGNVGAAGAAPGASS